MFGYLVLLFTLVPAIELMLLIEIGARIGAMNTIMIILLTGVTGASLARYQGFRVLADVQKNINQGIMPSGQLIDGFLILVGGILLLTPGFMTDILGFLLLIPLTRALIKIWLARKFQSMIQQGQVVAFRTESRATKHFDDNNDNYIDI